MNKIIIIFSIFFCANTISAQGLKLDKEKYENTPTWEAPKKHGFATAVKPTKISYRKYCPTPNSQGSSATCVGWAVAYEALSTQLNIEMNITNPIHKWVRSFDPHFVYGFVRGESDAWCQEGASLAYGMETIKKYGCKPFIWEPWLNCNDSVTFNEFTLNLASYYTIEEWYAAPKENIVEKVKEALYNEFTVVVGINLTKSFMSGNTVSYGQWTPKSDEESIGGHAMCIIGYDDTKFGGAFEIMNSYGTEFGDKGFVWVSYKDFEKTVGEAYIMKTSGYKTGNCSFGDCLNSYSRFKFINGDVYEGIIKNAELDVYGAMLYSNGSAYIGEWKKGRKNGYGLLYDVESNKFYNTLYENDVLKDYTEKKGFALSENEKKSQLKINEIAKSLPITLADPKDFETTQKVLAKYEAPDKPINVKTENNTQPNKPVKNTPKNTQKKQSGKAKK